METIEYAPTPTGRAFIKDYLKGELFYNWICGPLGCLPGDSEFLTPTGWKRMDAYVTGDKVAVYDGSSTVAFEEARYVNLPTDKPFHVFDSGSLVMELSDQHNVLYDDYRGVRRVATAGLCAAAPSRRTIPTTFNLYRPDANITDVEIRLRIAFSADGHTPPRGETSFTFRKDCKKVRLRELLADAGMGCREFCYDGRPTERTFKIERQEWTKSLAWVWGLSQRQLAIVIEECLLWDGLADHVEKRYFTSIKENADAIQFASHATGFRATITAVPPKQDHWAITYTVAIRVSDNAKNRAMIRAETRIETRGSDDGRMYCFNTSTGYFVARCRGTVFLTGNSGKTTANFMKLIYMAQLQQRGADGTRKTRCVIVRNTSSQLKDTTMKSWFDWFEPGVAGHWHATDKVFDLKFGDVECEVLFRPLDTEEDVARVLSLEVTFAIIDEFREVPRAIVDALSGRLGRYPSKRHGGSTNHGMWGASNPGTEDVWWYDYLHNPERSEKIELFGSTTQMAMEKLKDRPGNGLVSRYFHQPGGMSEYAENLENLPPYKAGDKSYYINQAKDKTPAWIKQYIDAEWGYSASETPVIKTFSADRHVSRSRLRYQPIMKLVGGMDPGLGGTAIIFGQEDLHGRLACIGELGAANMGVTRFIRDMLKPYLRAHFPDADFVIAPDPAGSNRTQTNEDTVVLELRKHFQVRTSTNNRMAPRIEAIEHFTTRTTEYGSALIIDKERCPMLCRALAGGWRYEKVKRSSESEFKAEPDKNEYSHYGDAFSYLCQYYFRSFTRSGARGEMAVQGGKVPLLRQRRNSYFAQ